MIMKKLIKIQEHYHVIDNKVKIIATTNPSLPLPQITDASDELVGKEVEVEIIHNWLKLEDKEPSDFAIIKPISKETSTNETLEEVAWKKYTTKTQEDEGLRDAFIAGYKHAESKMYSEDEVLNKLNSFYIWTQQQIINGKRLLNSEDTKDWFNNNKNN